MLPPAPGVTDHGRPGKIAAMYFEHLVALDDPAQPPGAPLDRAALWRGLWLRVEQPERFMPGIVGVRIRARQPGCLWREVDFGHARIVDCVTFQEGKWLRFSVEAGDGHAGGTLSIDLETSPPDNWALRFRYETDLDLDGVDGPYLEYLKSAYQAADLETVRVIREALAAGRAD